MTFDPREYRREAEQKLRAIKPVRPKTKVIEVTARPVTWAWCPYMPGGQITILGGPGGACKGLIAASICSAVSTGGPWPATDVRATRGTVLWCETEDPLAEVIRPRLDAAQADCSQIYYVKPDGFDLDDVKAMIRGEELRQIIMSPMVSFLRGLTDINLELGARSVLQDLQDAIEGTACAVLGTAHTNKKADLRAIERVLGSVAFVNFVRSVLLVSRDREDEDCFRLVHAKHNLSVRGDDLLLRPKHVGLDPHDQFVLLDWRRPETGNAEPDEMFDRRKPNGYDGSTSAGQWLVTYLRTNGECLRAEVIIAGDRAGFKEDALRKAHERNPRLKSRQGGFQGPAFWWFQ